MGARGQASQTAMRPKSESEEQRAKELREKHHQLQVSLYEDVRKMFSLGEWKGFLLRRKAYVSGHPYSEAVFVATSLLY